MFVLILCITLTVYFVGFLVYFFCYKVSPKETETFLFKNLLGYESKETREYSLI